MFQDNACWRQGGVLGSEVVKGKAEMAVYVSEEVESLVWIFLYVCGGLHYGDILKTLACLYSEVFFKWLRGKSAWGDAL